jgi:hypothetical protein
LSVDRDDRNLIAELFYQFFLCVNIYDVELKLIAFLNLLKKQPGVFAQMTALARVQHEMEMSQRWALKQGVEKSKHSIPGINAIRLASADLPGSPVGCPSSQPFGHLVSYY